MGKAAGRVMGIDFGTRHIGVAVSDELRVIARGIETVNWNGEDPEWALNRICEIIKEMEVNAIVIGRPARTDGTRSETQDKAEAFGASLAERCGIEPVFKDERYTTVLEHRLNSASLAERCGIEPVFKDERYTTVLASRYLHESNMKSKKQKKVIDQVAAEIILQDYLDVLSKSTSLT